LVEVSSDKEIISGGHDNSKPFSFPNRFETAFLNEMLYFRTILESKNPMDFKPMSPPGDDITTFK